MVLDKFSVGVIFRDHLKTMRSFGQEKLNWIEVSFVFGVPLLSMVVQVLMSLKLTENVASIVVSATSIFAGMLLNLWVLLYSIISGSGLKQSDHGIDDEKEKELIKQLFANISFAILACVIIVIFSLITLTCIRLLVLPAQAVVYFFGPLLFILVSQILKRFHMLLEHKVEKKFLDERKEKKW